MYLAKGLQDSNLSTQKYTRNMKNGFSLNYPQIYQSHTRLQNTVISLFWFGGTEQNKFPTWAEVKSCQLEILRYNL